MKQLELVSIPPQPEHKAAEIQSAIISRYVKEALRDYSVRQAAREQRRKQYRENEKKPRKKITEPETDMITIPVTFRAIFEQPTGVLNPLDVKVPGPQPVEVFRKGEHWYARELSTPKRNVFERLGKMSSSDSAKNEVERSFAKKLTDWQFWGVPPMWHPAALKRDFAPAERILEPEEFCDMGDGKAGFYTAENYTHIIHPPSYPAGTRVPPAACGAEKLPSKAFINNRANVRPSCKACAEVWEKEYKDK